MNESLEEQNHSPSSAAESNNNTNNNNSTTTATATDVVVAGVVVGGGNHNHEHDHQHHHHSNSGNTATGTDVVVAGGGGGNHGHDHQQHHHTGHHTHHTNHQSNHHHHGNHHYLRTDSTSSQGVTDAWHYYPHAAFASHASSSQFPTSLPSSVSGGESSTTSVVGHTGLPGIPGAHSTFPGHYILPDAAWAYGANGYPSATVVERDRNGNPVNLAIAVTHLGKISFAFIFMVHTTCMTFISSALTSLIFGAFSMLLVLSAAKARNSN